MPNHPPPPQKFVNFALTLRKIADHNFGITIHSFGKIVHRVWLLNGMALILYRDNIDSSKLGADPCCSLFVSYSWIYNLFTIIVGPKSHLFSWWTWQADGFYEGYLSSCIYGWQDVFSGRLMFLKVWTSNSNPKLVGRWYLEYLYDKKGTVITVANVFHNFDSKLY